MDDLRSLRATCSSMRRICGDPAVDQRVAVDRCRHGVRSSNDHVNYFALLARLTQVNNLEACLLTRIQTIFAKNHSPRPCLDYLTRAATGRHNVVGYLVVIFLYRHSGDASDDNTVMRYIRRVKGEEESRAAAAGGGGGQTSRQLSNKGCRLCSEATANVIHKMTWWRNKWPPLPVAQVRGDLPCSGDDCGVPKGWEQRTLFCSEDCRLRVKLFCSKRQLK
jgi:hypothetical protein